MTKPLFIFLSALVFFSAVAMGRAEAGDVAALCDRLAAHPLDPDKPAEIKGVFEITEDVTNHVMIGIEPSNDWAHSICEMAVKVYVYDKAPQHYRCCGSFAHFYPARRFQFQLGRAFEFESRFEEAAATYRQAADAGSSAAMVGLGVLYDEGKGVNQDPATAKMWFEKAAALNHAGAFTMLGCYAEKGIEGKKDAVMAIGFYRRGAVLGDEAAKEALKRFNCPIIPSDVEGYVDGKDCTDAVR